MIKKFALFIPLLAAVILLSACNKLTSNCDCGSKTSSPGVVNFAYEDDSYKKYINFTVSSDDIPSKTTEIRDFLSSIENCHIQNFSYSPNNANTGSISVLVPKEKEQEVYNFLSKNNEITQFNESSSRQIGIMKDIKKYYAYKTLLANFDEIKKIIERKNDKNVDYSVLKEDIEDEIKKGKYSLERYELEKGKTKINIFIKNDDSDKSTIQEERGC